MKFFTTFFIVLSVMVKAECPYLDGAPDLPPALGKLLPSDQLLCAQKFYQYQNSDDLKRPHFCTCLSTQNPMDPMASSTAITKEEDQRLKNLIEDLAVEHAKAAMETMFTNAIYFDAYVRRGALDTRFLANMDKCRLRGIVDSLKKQSDDCNQTTYQRRLAKFLNFPESEVKQALTTESTRESLFSDFLSGFKESMIPLAKNIIPSHLPNACMPFKAFLMFSAPPIDDELFDQTLRSGGLDQNKDEKKQLLGNYLNMPSMGASFLSKVEHPLGWMAQDHREQMEHNARIAGNHPLMLMVFQDEKILEDLKLHIANSDRCQSEQTNRYNQATDPEYHRHYDEKLAELTALCLPGSGYKRCLREKKNQAAEFARTKIPGHKEWVKQQSIAGCETYQDFFQKEKNINEIIKAQNNKCEKFRRDISTEFLCKEDLSSLKPTTMEFELGPKIFNAFGTDAPRIFNHYLKKHYCKITQSGDSAQKHPPEVTPLENAGIIDHLRPQSELTDLRHQRVSDYERYNNFLCKKMKGRRPDGTTFACDNISARPPECNQSIYFKQMACQALKSELDGVTPKMEEERKRDYFLAPEEYNGLAHHQSFPSSRESLDHGPMILEFQRLANTLPGNLGANCTLPNPLPTDSASVSSWFASEERRVAQGSGSGSGSSVGDAGAAFFSDYFLEGTTDDETHLVEFRAKNPGLSDGTVSGTILPVPYERRVEVAPTTLILPTPVPTAVATPANPSGLPEVANDPTLSKLGGSLAERGISPRAPASVSPATVPHVANPANVLAPTPTPGQTPATPGPLANDQSEELRRMQEYERKLRDLERREAELAAAGRRTEAERIKAEIARLKRELEAFNNSNNNVVKVTPTPTPNAIVGPTPAPTAGPKVGGGAIAGRTGSTGVRPGAERKIASGGGGGGSSSRGATSAARNLAGVSGGGGGASRGLDGFAAKLKNSRYHSPVEPFTGRPGGFPGIKPIKDHLPYESPQIIAYELIDIFGLKKVVMYFHLEGKTFSALKALEHGDYEIIVYAFNPSELEKNQLERPEEVDRRIRVKRLLEELRATPSEAAKNAGAFSTAADNTHELTRETLLTEHERKMALTNMIPPRVLDKAWDELPHFVLPPTDLE
ncbi:MAG TPA: hypothetical protein DCY86_02785 [Bdellovibrionales bacterium]|nr:hypothetical protein [Bdellovibrionales bacterium]